MGVMYQCDICGTSADSLTGWQVVQVRFDWIDPIKPTPPGGRTVIGEVDVWFDKPECRNQWATAAGVTMPPIPEGMKVNG